METKKLLILHGATVQAAGYAAIVVALGILVLSGCSLFESNSASPTPARPMTSHPAEIVPDSAPENQAVPSPKEEFDPLAGIDVDGRIPKVQLGIDLKNPERWRYLPEGRIHPGSMVDRFLISTFFAPIFFFESDVGAGGGFSLTDIDFRNQRRREFASFNVSYTTKGQQNYSLRWRRWLHHRDLPEKGAVQEDRSFLDGSVGYSKTLTRRFYGFGADTKEQDETFYTDEVVGISLGLNQSIPEAGDDFVYHLGVRGEYRDLEPGDIRSEIGTETAFPREFDDGDDYASLWLSTGLRYDTRDNQHIPYGGGSVGVFGRVSPVQENGEVGAILSGNASWVFEMPPLFHDGGDKDEEHPPIDTLAFGGFASWTEGKLPFWALPSLGGSNTLRGYIANRFTDRAAYHLSAEYRFWTIPRGISLTRTIRVERLGAALFYELGSVASLLSSLDTSRVLDSYGVSFRATFDEQALFRVDIGFSEEDSNLTIAYGLSF